MTQIETKTTLRPDGLTYCIVRGYKMGVVCGWVDYERVNKSGFDIFEGRQMYRWDSQFVLADLAQSGVRKVKNCKFSEPCDCQRVLDPYQVFKCTDDAREFPNANR